MGAIEQGMAENRRRCLDVLGTPRFKRGDRVRSTAGKFLVSVGRVGTVTDVLVATEFAGVVYPDAVGNPDPATDRWVFEVAIDNDETSDEGAWFYADQLDPA